MNTKARECAKCTRILRPGNYDRGVCRSCYDEMSRGRKGTLTHKAILDQLYAEYWRDQELKRWNRGLASCSGLAA